MFRKKTQRESAEYLSEVQNEKIHFDWTDILAFIIAFFQVLFPYILITIISYLVIAFLLHIWII